ncbi:MAG: nitroreductase [Bacteroidales bacterium]|nr:nitroreductase [Candidatus Sodaliphilus aphodohippi]
MNSVIENMITRRSVRNFSDRPVPQELIEEIVKAGTYAPTGRNRQAPIIIAVTNKEMRDRLSRMNADVLGTTADPFYGAPVVLIVLAKKDVNTFIYDGSLVMGNLMLASHSLGIGSCWIHRAKEEFESTEGREILRSLGIEDEYEGIGHCVLGYSAQEGPVAAPPRKADYVYWIK